MRKFLNLATGEIIEGHYTFFDGERYVDLPMLQFTDGTYGDLRKYVPFDDSIATSQQLESEATNLKQLNRFRSFLREFFPTKTGLLKPRN